MTQQIKDVLTFDGKTESIFSEPFDSYEGHPQFTATFSANWRGYVAGWRLDADKLYLIAIYGSAVVNEQEKLAALERNYEICVKGEREYVKIKLDYLFPNQTAVFAYWFSGEIAVPNSELMCDTEGWGYKNTSEEFTHLAFTEGVLVGKRVVKNDLSNTRIFKDGESVWDDIADAPDSDETITDL